MEWQNYNLKLICTKCGEIKEEKVIFNKEKNKDYEIECICPKCKENI